MEINTLTIGSLLNAMEQGTASSEQAVSALLDFIEQSDQKLGAYLHVDREDALQQARDADLKRKAGVKSRLLGVPIALKDNISVRGQPLTCASQMLKNFTAKYDASVVEKLKSEGAVLLGRTNMDEFAVGSTTETSAYKITRNPRNYDYIPGGSSGGLAAAVAAGSAIAGLGTDSGGSNRQPASFCGCVGVKPSYGRVSRYGAVSYASSFDQIGPIAKNIYDAALLLDIISGYDKRDNLSAHISYESLTKEAATDLSGVRIGVPKEYFSEGIDAVVEKSVRTAINLCKDIGATVSEISLPHTEHADACYYILSTAEGSANLARFDGIRYGHRAGSSDDISDLYSKSRGEGFGAEVKKRIIMGTYFLSSGNYDTYYVPAQKIRRLIRRDFEEAYGKVDVILAPVSLTLPWRIGEKKDSALQAFASDAITSPVNLAGNCAVSLPCGIAANNLPIGLQIIGPAFGESIVFKTAFAYERARGDISYGGLS